MAAGLLDRSYRYYVRTAILAYTLLGLAVLIPFSTPATTGWSLVAAGLMGFALVQVGLLGHDAGHLAVFRGVRANQVLGQLCWSASLAIGFYYWNDRHTRHHASTNDPGDDPDLAGLGPFVREADQAADRGRRRVMVAYQALIALVLLFFLAWGFRLEGWLFTLRRVRGWRRATEIGLLVLGSLLWLAPSLPLGWRWVIIYFFSQIVASVYMTLVIAPNHHGMPVWRSGAQVPFLERQVLSSRNTPAHPLWDFIFGGLNSQIEHHLFPRMPRPNLGRARTLIKPFCETHGLRYAESSPFRAYVEVFTAAGHTAGTDGDQVHPASRCPPPPTNPTPEKGLTASAMTRSPGTTLLVRR